MERDKNADNNGDDTVRPEEQSELSRAMHAPSSRWGRLARLSFLAPKVLPVMVGAAKRVAGKKLTEEQEREVRQRTYEDAKKAGAALLKTLGEMKGLPMKLGQMFGYIDGLAPPGYEDKVKRLLQRLCDQAPPLSPEAAEQTIISEFGMEPSLLFAEYEREPFAAASIGQVHRAVTRCGDEVAVKVQYPGIDKAIENDLKSLSMLEAVFAPLSRQYQSKEGLQEITSVFMAELDYGNEAENTDLFRQMFADRSDILVPAVYHSLSTRHVLTTQMLHGIGYEEFRTTAPQEDRDRAGVTIWTFMMRSLLVDGVLYADPHPGNYRFMDNGRVGFLDFGCVKIMPSGMLQNLKAYMLAAMDADWPRFDKLCVDFMGMDPSDKHSWDLYRSYAIALLLPVTTRAVFEFTPEGAKEAVQYLVRGHRNMIKEAEGGPKLPSPIHMPYDLTFLNRLQWGLASIMGGLGTRAYFREITEPWIRANVSTTKS